MAFFVARLRIGFLRSGRSFTTLHLLSSIWFIIMYYCFLWLFSSLPFSLFLKDYVFKRIFRYYSYSEVSERNTSTRLCLIHHFSPQGSRLNQKPFLIVYTTRYHSHTILQSLEWFTKVNIASEQVESGPSPGHPILEGSESKNLLAKSWLIWKEPDAGKDWGQEEKGTTEDEMVGWHHWLDAHGFGWTPGVGDGQGGLACCGSWGHKESDITERLNWLNEVNKKFIRLT